MNEIAGCEIKVYGIRKCRECGGICHEGSWRKSFGQRRQYFCSKNHLDRHYRGTLREWFREHGIDDWQTTPISEEWVDENREKFYEQVDVITPRNGGHNG